MVVGQMIPSREVHDILSGNLACLLALGAVPRAGFYDNEGALVARHAHEPAAASQGPREAPYGRRSAGRDVTGRCRRALPFSISIHTRTEPASAGSVGGRSRGGAPPPRVPFPLREVGQLLSTSERSARACDWSALSFATSSLRSPGAADLIGDGPGSAGQVTTSPQLVRDISGI
jgi:hypothetical protein